MKDRAETSVPEHLQELLQPTPSGTAKLIAAWDGLTPETQIAVLIEKKKRPGPAYLYERIIEKALTSDNAFVRYMAARDAHLDDRDQREKDLRAQIDNDPEPLVRYAHLETPAGSSELEDAEEFFALPHEARLAKVRSVWGWGEVIANLVSHAVEHQLKDGRVSEMELLEILSDYLNNPRVRIRYSEDLPWYDGFAKLQAGKDIEALWGLVLKVPESLSHVVIENLPESAGFCHGIPKYVLDGMSDRQLETLFYRSDIGLKELRKQKFLEAVEGDAGEKEYAKDRMQSAAVTHAFDLTNEEFAKILLKPAKPRVKILKMLSGAEDLRLCLYEATHDDLLVSDVSFFGAGDEAESARETLARKLARLKGWQRDKELRELKLYRLAVDAQKGYPPSGELAFLVEAIVEGDTWATFVAFFKKWDEAHYQTKRLEKHLPKIWEAGEKDELPLDEEDINDTNRLANQLANKLADLVVTAQDEPEGEESKLAEALGKLSGHATVTQEKTLEAVNSLKAEFTEFRRSHNRLAWIVIGLLMVLFFVGR
jgi:hypothetical protein